MKGNIYVNEHCHICGKKLRHDERRSACLCPDHPKVRASGPFHVRFGREISTQFSTYEKAARALTGFRYETDRGTFDPRDYRRDNPMGFSNLAEKWLEMKQKAVKHESYINLKNYMTRAMGAWNGINIKLIGYGEIEDFLYAQEVSDKTRANAKSCLHDFWHWLKKRRVLRPDQMPEFPEIHFELGYRKIVTLEDQEAIMDEVRRISYDINPKIWLGIHLLASYPIVRPGELRNVREKDINLESGYIHIPHPKERKGKYIYLLDEDIELLAAFPRGLPELFFFRHEAGRKGVVAGGQFGPKLWNKYWLMACANLGIEGVPVYPGTKHSTATGLGKHLTPEQIKEGTGHATNKAFERYYQPGRERALAVYRKRRDLKKVATKTGEVVEFGKGKKR